MASINQGTSRLPRRQSSGRHRNTSAVSDCARCMARELAVCAVIEPEESSELERLAYCHDLADGDILVHSGQPVRHVYSVTQGMLRRVCTLADGRRLVAGFSLPGDFIGLSDLAEHRYSIEAVTASQVCAFTLDDLRALRARFPKLEHTLFERACMELDMSQDSMLLLARLSPLERLAHFLLQFGQQLQRRSRLRRSAACPKAPNAAADHMLVLPMSRHDIADHLGLTVETVSRSFTKLRQMELIDLPNPQWVHIQDHEALARLASAAG